MPLGFIPFLSLVVSAALKSLTLGRQLHKPVSSRSGGLVKCCVTDGGGYDSTLKPRRCRESLVFLASPRKVCSLYGHIVHWRLSCLWLSIKWITAASLINWHNPIHQADLCATRFSSVWFHCSSTGAHPNFGDCLFHLQQNRRQYVEFSCVTLPVPRVSGFQDD